MLPGVDSANKEAGSQREPYQRFITGRLLGQPNNVVCHGFLEAVRRGLDFESVPFQRATRIHGFEEAVAHGILFHPKIDV